MIYLAAPFWHANRGIREARQYAMGIILSWFVSQDRIAFSPLSHAETASRFDRASEKQWFDLGKFFLKISTRFIIVQLPGWEESKGIKKETQFWVDSGGNVEFFDPQIYLDGQSYLAASCNLWEYIGGKSNRNRKHPAEYHLR